MPIIDRNDPLVAAVRSGVPSSMALPNLREMIEDAQGSPFAAQLAAQFAWKQVEAYQVGAQLSLGAIASRVGVPVYGMFESVVGILGQDVVQLVNEAAVETFGDMSVAFGSVFKDNDGGKLIAMGAWEGAGFAVNSMSWVPIAGWIVKLVWNLAKAIKNIVDIAKSSDAYAKAERIYPPSVFNPTADALQVNAVLSRLANLQSHDWTPFFSPPSLGPTGGLQSRWFWFEKLDHGWRIKAARPPDDGADYRLGMVPGTRVLHQGIEYFTSAESGVPRGPRDMGDVLLPSAQQQLTWVWKHVMGRGGDGAPAMYTVDATKVRERWAGYIYELHRFVYDADVSDDAKRSVMEYWDGPPSTYVKTLKPKRMVGGVFGWGTSLRPLGNEYDYYFPVKECEVLEARQRRLLETDLCAYVDDSFAAIAQNPALRDVWDRERRDLLQHPPTVCRVDVDSIPDVVFREQVLWRREKCTPYAGGSGTIGSPIPDRHPKPERVPDGSAGAPGLGDGASSGGGGVGMLFALGALLGGGYLWARGR